MESIRRHVDQGRRTGEPQSDPAAEEVLKRRAGACLPLWQDEDLAYLQLGWIAANQVLVERH